MNYRVAFRDRVANNIASVTFLAFEMGLDGRVIARAADEILLRLSDAPATEGESRGAAERVLIVGPLTVVFEVFEDSNTVLIYDAVYYPRQRL